MGCRGRGRRGGGNGSTPGRRRWNARRNRRGSSSGRRRGPAGELGQPRGERGSGLLDRLDGLLGSADPSHLEVAEKCENSGDDEHEDEDDQECRPAPQPGIQEFGQEEEHEEGGVEQHDQGNDEKDAAGQALLHVPGDFRLGKFDLGPHQGRDLGAGVLDQVADRRIRRHRMRVHQRNRGSRGGHPVLAIPFAHGSPPESCGRGSCCHVEHATGVPRALLQKLLEWLS